MTEVATAMALPPIEKDVFVACSLERAFDVFTREIGSWWPTETHALHPGEVERVVWEGRVSGTIYEIAANGERAEWATILTWEPPHRLVIAWNVNPDRVGTQVEVRFSTVDGGTRVELEHRGFDNVVDGAAMRDGYDPGWGMVLGRFVDGLS